MPTNNPIWLDIVRHRIRSIRAPYLLIMQHHAIPASTRLAVPITLPVRGDMDATAPPILIDGIEYRARILDMSAVPRAILAETVGSASEYADAIFGALDVVLHGYPVGRLH